MLGMVVKGFLVGCWKCRLFRERATAKLFSFVPWKNEDRWWVCEECVVWMKQAARCCKAQLYDGFTCTAEMEYYPEREIAEMEYLM